MVNLNTEIKKCSPVALDANGNFLLETPKPGDYSTFMDITNSNRFSKIDSSRVVTPIELGPPAIGWTLTGNSSTVDGTNFIGTTDNIPLNFRVNNIASGRIDPTLNNTFFGFTSGNNSATGVSNVAMGAFSLQTLTSGNFNVAVGRSSLKANTTGAQNTAVGNFALFSNVSGNANVALGATALQTNSTGSFNIAIGISSLVNNTTGTNNVAVGLNSLTANVTGNFNTALGDTALAASTGGAENVAVGFSALRFNTSSNNVGVGSNALRTNNVGTNNIAVGYSALINAIGSQNVALGAFALSSQSTANTATALGYNADVNVGGLSDITVIGANAVGSVSHSVVLGAPTVTHIQFNGALEPFYFGAYKPGFAGQVLTSQGSGVAPQWTTQSVGWSITGNSGTVDGTNFIGTIDNVPLTFKVANQIYGRLDTRNDVFFGFQAGNSTLTGLSNVAIGVGALASVTTGSYNTALGAIAAGNTTTGSTNVAVGNVALSNNTSGTNNVAVGVNALSFNTTANNNTAVGVQALQTNTTGANNTALGFNADVSSVALSNVTVIGANAIGTVSNSIVLGASSVTQVQFNGALMPFYSAAYQAGTVGQVLTSQGAGAAPQWTTVSSSLSGSGTTNYLAKWTPNGTTLGDSLIQCDTQIITVGVTPLVGHGILNTYAPNTKLYINNNGAAPQILNSRPVADIATLGYLISGDPVGSTVSMSTNGGVQLFASVFGGGTGGSVLIQPDPTMTATITFTLPKVLPSTLKMLCSDNTGLMSFQTIPTGTIGGTIGVNQIATGNGSNVIHGTNNFTYNQTTHVFDADSMLHLNANIVGSVINGFFGDGNSFNNSTFLAFDDIAKKITLNSPTGTLQINLPSNGLNKVLTSDGSGNATWQTPSGASFSVVDITNAASPYTVLGTEDVINVDSTSGPVQINLLPASNPLSKKRLTIKDAKGQVNTNDIVLHPNATDLVDTVNADRSIFTEQGQFGAITVVSNLTSYSIV